MLVVDREFDNHGQARSTESSASRRQTMLKPQRFVLTLVVVSASFVPAANAIAGINLGNHNETLLRDD
jgi:hypothetical protein